MHINPHWDFVRAPPLAVHPEQLLERVFAKDGETHHAASGLVATGVAFDSSPTVARHREFILVGTDGHQLKPEQLDRGGLVIHIKGSDNKCLRIHEGKLKRIRMATARILSSIAKALGRSRLLLAYVKVWR